MKPAARRGCKAVLAAIDIAVIAAIDIASMRTIEYWHSEGEIQRREGEFVTPGKSKFVYNKTLG